MSHLFAPRHALLAFLVLVWFVPGALGAPLQFKTIALSGTPTEVTGISGNQSSSVTFTILLNPVVTESGNIGFRGSIAAGADAGEGVWLLRPGTAYVHTAAKENSPFPKTFSTFPTGVYGATNGQPTFGPLKTALLHDIAFRARLKGPEVTPDFDTGAHRWIGHRVIEMIQEGSQFSWALGGRGTFGDLFEIDESVQETSVIRFPIRGRPSDSDSLMWQSEPEGASVWGRGVSQTDRLGDLKSVRPLVFGFNSIYRGSLTGPTVNPTNDGAILTGSRVLVRESPSVESLYDPAPGYLPGDKFEPEFPPAETNDFRGFYFATRLADTVATDELHDTEIRYGRLQRGDRLETMARESQSVVGAGSGVVLGDLGTNDLVGGGNGQFLFSNQLRGPSVNAANDWALVGWSPSGKNVRVVAREGMAVEGLPDGAVLSNLEGPNFQ